MFRKSESAQKTPLRSVIALLLVLALLFSGCTSIRLNSVPAKDDDDGTKPTQTQTDPDNLPDPNRQYHYQEAELSYTLTEADVTAFYQALSDFEALVKITTNANTVLQAYDELDALFMKLATQSSVASVLYYCDLTDEAASDQYLDSQKIVTEAQDAYIEAFRRIYQADVPTKAQLFADWTEADLLMLEKYTSEITQLKQRNSEIEVAYQSIQDDPQFTTKMVPLFLEKVANNNRIAQILGYDNYYEYAYTMEYDRDYDAQQVEAMRSYAATYLVPTLQQSLQKYYTAAISLNTSDSTLLATLLYGSYQDTETPYVVNYIDTLPLYARESMLDMFDGNILIMDDTSSAREGAFTTIVDEDRMLCFYGPGYSNSLTVIHEAGHYYGGTFTFLNDIPLDLAEVHSQANELLFINYLKDELSATAYQTLLYYQLFSQNATILLSLAVDEFEQRVYAHQDPLSLTADDLYAIMENVCQKYGGSQFFTNCSLISPHEYWQYVVVEQPVYYISYAVSAVAAIDLYTVAAQDHDNGIVIYTQLIEDSDHTKGFLNCLQNAGLSGPFEESVYQKIYALVA